MPVSAKAVYDPLLTPNNRVGVHILDPQELRSAAKLVNSSGGDWGYVTVPLRSDDRNKEKWIEFFNTAAQQHVIPIIRLATFVDKDHWVTPTAYDLIDFANFLNEMPWPVKNRYIIVFNEPNHSKEWGGQVNPAEYAALLVQAKEIFSQRSPDFFIITAGLDMSAPQNNTSHDALNFYRQMFKAVPNWHRAVDGVSFHAYPNPGFTSSVESKSRFGPKSYTYELNELKKFGFNPRSIFITETGSLGSNPFYTPAFRTVWNESNIVAITPFLLFAGSADFSGFSLLNANHEPTSKYLEISSLPKIKGSPLLNNPQQVSNQSTLTATPATTSTSHQSTGFIAWLRSLIFKPEPTVKINNISIIVEVADTDDKRRQGLSNKPSLQPHHGMLFMFDKPQPVRFWMKDMLFGLDMIWIRDRKIVEISKNVPAPSATNGVPIEVQPAENVEWVVEVPAGYTDANSIKVGDSIELLNISNK